MKFIAEVDKQENLGESAEVTFTNVDRKNSAAWRSYSSDIELRIPFGKLKSYAIGRKVEIEVKPK